MDIFIQLHSYWAYITLLLLVFTFVSALYKFLKKDSFTQLDKRLALFSLIAVHIQLLLGLSWYFASPAYKHLKEVGMGVAMKDAHLRLVTVEHPLVMLLAITLITLGFSKQKRKNDFEKHQTIFIYYGIGLLLVLSRIPWSDWFK